MISININNRIFNSSTIGTFIFTIPGTKIEKKITIYKKNIEFNNIYNYFDLYKIIIYYIIQILKKHGKK